MEVILLERVPRLGQMGEVVRVKDGFARNFLLPRGKALRATQENRTRFETMKTDLEARSLTLKGEAGQVAAKLDGKSFTVLRQASESGQLFGSVSPRDLVGLITAGGFNVSRGQSRAHHADQNHRPAHGSIVVASRNRDIDNGRCCSQQRRSGADRARRGRHAIARRADGGGSRSDRSGSVLRA